MYNATLQDLLDSCDITESQYYAALDCDQKKLTVIYKWRPCEMNLGPYNTVTLSILHY